MILRGSESWVLAALEDKYREILWGKSAVNNFVLSNKKGTSQMFFTSVKKNFPF